MISRIEIISKVFDTRARVKKNFLENTGFKDKIIDLRLVDVYTIDKKLTPRELVQIASALTNPITQAFYINRPNSIRDFTWAFEIGFLPGVTDNIANTTKEIIEDLLKIKFIGQEGVYTSQLMLIKGNLEKKDIEEIVSSLINPLIQRIQIKKKTQYQKERGMGKIVPYVKLDRKLKVESVNLEIPDKDLQEIGKLGILNVDGKRNGPLALDLTYLKAIQVYFRKKGRKPSDIELESIAQTWSEHCKHTIFADPLDEIKDGLFNAYIKKATKEIRQKNAKKDFCVSVFTDNSGAIEFNSQYLITHKVETHNSPSALDPFGGVITGIGGVNRDAIGFGKGAKPIVNFYGFCFADPKINKPLYKGPNFTQKMLSPRRILDGVIAGVNSGGNCSGIPTPLGFIYFDKRYQGKPLVFVGTLGLIPKKVAGKPSFIKKARAGDYIVVVGGRVGLDGIHGATFSSEAMDSGSPAGAVQIGDPITQKKLSDALVKEARDLNLYDSITDNGAGGLSCSVPEMAKESNGCLVELEKVPLKYPGLDPWQIWISESQERMTIAVPSQKWKKFNKLMKKRGVEATVIGKFTDSGKCIVKYFNRTIMDIEMDFLHNGLPQRKLTSTFSKPVYKEPEIPLTNNLTPVFLKMLSRLNISSFNFISGQYDHEVQSNSVIKPLIGRGRVNGETVIVKPVFNSNKGIVLSYGLYPSYGDIDTYHMAGTAIDTAIRNIVTAGGDIDKIALLDNFCWCSSLEAERLGQLKRAVKACYDYALAYKTPFISGKDSMFNDFKGFNEKGIPIKISVPPTLLISSLGIINDITKAITLDAKFSGNLVYILGETYEELGGSEYFSLFNAIGNQVPKVNALKNLKLYKALAKCIQKGLIASALGVGRGGLAVALAKTAMGGLLGMEISLKNLQGKVLRDDFALFSESQGRILITINPKNQKQFQKMMKGNKFALVGHVTNDNIISIHGLKNQLIIKTKVINALKVYRKTFKDY